jgi:hypothetical protein
LIYFNLSKERTFAFVQDVAFHDRVISLVKDPMRQIGLNFSSLFSWGAVTDEVIHHNCNNVHYIAFEGALPTTQISLIDNVHILRFIGAWCVSDVSSFNNTVELSLLFSAPILREIGERDIQKVRSLFIERTPRPM